MIIFFILAFASPNVISNLILSIQGQSQIITDIGSDLLDSTKEQRIPELFYHVEELDKKVKRLEELYKNP